MIRVRSNRMKFYLTLWLPWWNPVLLITIPWTFSNWLILKTSVDKTLTSLCYCRIPKWHICPIVGIWDARLCQMPQIYRIHAMASLQVLYLVPCWLLSCFQFYPFIIAWILEKNLFHYSRYNGKQSIHSRRKYVPAYVVLRRSWCSRLNLHFRELA